MSAGKRRAAHHPATLFVIALIGLALVRSQAQSQEARFELVEATIADYTARFSRDRSPVKDWSRLISSGPGPTTARAIGSSRGMAHQFRLPVEPCGPESP